MKQRAKDGSKSEIKVSSLFGRSYFIISKNWKSIKSSIILPPYVYTEMFEYFLQNFENSLIEDTIDEKNILDDTGLVWAENFAEVLKKRQEIRKVEAVKRLADNSNDYYDGNDDYSDNEDDVDNNENLKSET
jgi:hypothetical protein